MSTHTTQHPAPAYAGEKDPSTYTFRDLRDCEARRARGEQLSATDVDALRMIAKLNAHPAVVKFRAHVREFEPYARRVEAMPARLRARFERMTLREIRRALPPIRPTRARAPRTRERRPGAARRTGSSSATASADPGDPEPPAGPPERTAAHRVALAWLLGGADVLGREDAER